jgi:hypothetical protein
MPVGVTGIVDITDVRPRVA